MLVSNYVCSCVYTDKVSLTLVKVRYRFLLRYCTALKYATVGQVSPMKKVISYEEEL